ncbi:PAS domain-containing protein [Rhizobium leguminosarum]
METHPFYQTLNKMGLKYFATVPICPDWRMNAGVAVQRKVGRAPYSEDELDLLTMLGRHVERAFRLGAKLLDSEMSSIGLGNALNKLGMGIFILDGLCRVTFANSAAERLLGETHTMADDRLILPPALRTEFRKVVKQVRGPLGLMKLYR